MEQAPVEQVVAAAAQRAVGTLAAPAWLTTVGGDLYGSLGSIKGFIKHHGVRWQNAERCQEKGLDLAACAGRYADLDNFFTRRLAPKARRIDRPGDDRVLVSQASCQLTAFSVFKKSALWVKGKGWSVAALLGRSEPSRDMAVLIFRLQPSDYHRVHLPCRAKVVRVTRIAGSYLTVNPLLVRSGRDVLTRNARCVIDMWSPDIGPFVTVMVGATIVGDIHVIAPANRLLPKGAEFGYYSLGGSTNVMLLPAERVALRPALLSASARSEETPVRAGQAIGRLV